MTEPKRLRETHATRLEGLLLAAVRAEAPSPSARARTMRAVVAGMAAGGAVVTTAGSASAASGAVPAAKASVLLLAGKWLAVGAGAGLLVTGSLVGPLHHLMEPASADSRDSTAHVPVVPGRASPASEAQVTGPNGEQAATPVVDAPGEAPPAKPANPSKAPDAQRARPAPLAAEVAAIDLAARAVAERDPARGLVALDAYEKAFPGGVLRPEATVLRVQALVQQGDRPRAVAIARVFLAQHPHSPHADRLRSLVGVD